MPPLANRLQVFIVMLMVLALFFRFLVWADSMVPVREKRIDATVSPPLYGN